MMFDTKIHLRDRIQQTKLTFGFSLIGKVVVLQDELYHRLYSGSFVSLFTCCQLCLEISFK